jgi:hypothetical protein
LIAHDATLEIANRVNRLCCWAPTAMWDSPNRDRELVGNEFGTGLAGVKVLQCDGHDVITVQHMVALGLVAQHKTDEHVEQAMVSL